MKKAALILLILIVITACQRNTFMNTYNKMLELDKEYGGSFQKEMINGTSVDILNIPRYIADLEKLKSEAVRSNAADKNASLSLIRARIDMLKAESSWHTANLLKGKRALKREDGVLCTEADLVKAQSEWMQDTIKEAVNATLHLDDLIAYYPQYREIIGYNENKSRFYYSPTCYIGHYARLQLEAVNKICNNASAKVTNRTIVALPPPVCITP